MNIFTDITSWHIDRSLIQHIKHLENVLAQAKAAHEFRLEMLDKFGEDNVHTGK